MIKGLRVTDSRVTMTSREKNFAALNCNLRIGYSVVARKYSLSAVWQGGTNAPVCKRHYPHHPPSTRRIGVKCRMDGINRTRMPPAATNHSLRQIVATFPTGVWTYRPEVCRRHFGRECPCYFSLFGNNLRNIFHDVYGACADSISKPLSRNR